jgi:hypothetical protein
MALLVPGEEDASVTALRRLVAEIALGDYGAPARGALTSNPVYLEAVALLDALDVVGPRS